MKSKICCLCKNEKPRTLKYFSRRLVAKDGLTARCKDCLNKSYKTQRENYKKNNPEKVAKSNRNWRFKKLYGISLKEYEELNFLQKDLCGICKLPETRVMRGKLTGLVVDHCHITGRIRGLICDSCNVGLGRFKDSSELVEKALVYLKRFEETL